MKTESDIRKQLQEVYAHRLSLRIDRKTKKICRNCKNGINKEFDLGVFGTMNRWQCKLGNSQCTDCNKFVCMNSVEDIEKEMILDISDPSTCGAKQPKIAMLLWVLHDSKKHDSSNSEEAKRGFLQKVKGFFK